MESQQPSSGWVFETTSSSSQPQRQDTSGQQFQSKKVARDTQQSERGIEAVDNVSPVSETEAGPAEGLFF